MIKTFDGNSYKRVGGKPGDRNLIAGFSRLRVLYTATGGETSINLTSLSSEFSYLPGAAQIEVKRSSGGALISGADFFENSTTSITFPTADPLIAGEVVEITRQVHVSGIAAIKPRPDSFEQTATLNQTLISATFSWPYNMQPCGVQLYFNGIRLRRNVDFTEVDLGTGNTNQVLLIDAANGGENIIMEPNYSPIDQNGATNSFTATQLSNIQSLLQTGSQAFVDQTGSIAAPGTTITNRALITDINNDLKARFGCDRIAINAITQIQNESGPNGERVFAAVNDTRGLIRFVGIWSILSDTIGTRPYSSSPNDYVEITFFGKGLNLLTSVDSLANRDARVSVNSGAETSNIFPTSAANILAGRGYAPNQRIKIASGLPLQVHTIKIRVNDTLNVYGFEIINEDTAIKVNPGTAYINGQKYLTTAAQSLSYNSTFESGTLGTRGGRVVIYQKPDGTIAKAVQPVNPTSAYFTSADHSNEELSRVHYFREFGASRSDDFSTLSTTTSNRIFTLDDGTTTVLASSVQASSTTGIDAIYHPLLGSYTTVTFIGTGFDLITNTNGSANSTTVAIDGTSIGNFDYSSTKVVATKIASGLPYGTHTIKFTANGSSGIANIIGFKIYQPKKPTVAQNTIELSDYNVLANYSFAAAPGLETISTGVIRKYANREITYVNGTGGTGDWNVGSLLTANQIGGYQPITDRQNAYFEYVFFGTGFDLRYQSASNRSANMPLLINGLPATTTNYATLTSTALTGSTFSTSTGLLNMNVSLTTGSGVSIRGLPLATYTIRLTNPSTGLIPIEAIDIHSPVHSVRSSESYDANNSYMIGSCSLSDNRKSTPIKESVLRKKNTSIANGITVSPTTSSTAYVPLPDLSAVIKTNGDDIELDFCGTFINTAFVNSIYVRFYVDGIAVGNEMSASAPGANLSFVISNKAKIPVSAGTHKVDVYWRVDGSTFTAYQTQRVLTVKES
jgi:hypothetical protein